MSANRNIPDPLLTNDPKYWKLSIFYFNKNDKRTLVPMRNPKLGQTFNFASPNTYWIFLGVVITVILTAIVPDFIAGR